MIESVEGNVAAVHDDIPTVRVVDIPLFDGSIEDAASIVMQQILAGTKNSYCISATGAHGIVTARKDELFRKTLNSFYINLPDGMPGVWAGRLKGSGKMRRCYGPDFFAHMMKTTAGSSVKHYFCGGREGVARKLKEACARKFGNHNIGGFFSPPFREMTDAELAELTADIEQNHTDILWIGISTPKQEKFAERIAKVCKVHFIVTVGAAFDFHIGNVRQAPGFVQSIGLEWFYRLCMEPSRLWKRYVEIVPLFIFYNLSEFFYVNKNNS